MKKKAFVTFVAATLFICICTSFVFADTERTEAKFEIINTEVYEYDFGDPEKAVSYSYEPLTEWISAKLSDDTEVKFMEDDSKTSLEGSDLLNLFISQRVKRDEVLKLQKLKDDVTWFKIYDVQDGEVGNTLYTDTLPANRDYVITILSNSEETKWYDDISDEYPIVHDGHIYKGAPLTISNYQADYAYIKFEYGLEEQEVIDAIAALPEESDVKLTDEDAITAARTAYDSLEKWKTTEPADPDIQNKVTNYSKLVACENALAGIKAEETAKETAKENANTAISAANALSASDYTEDTFKAVTDAKATLEAVLAKKDATSDEIEEATAALNDAISKLEKKAATIVKKDQPMTVKAVFKKVSFKKLKKAKQVVAKALIVKKNQGTVTYKRISGSKKLTINKKTGKITVKKGTKKGLYKIKVKVTAKGNTNYKAGSKTKTVKIRVK